MELFAKLSRAQNLTLFFCSHHVEHALHYAASYYRFAEFEATADCASGTEKYRKF